MSFWWEDGYVAGANEITREKDRSKRPDGVGTAYLVQNTETKAHHLDAKWNRKLRQLITLDGVGKQDTRIRVRSATDGSILNEFEVHCKSGFIAVSGDGAMVAVAVLKEDTIEIYELSSGDLLLSLDGRRKEGFWGSLVFLPGSNRLIELRSIEYARGVSKRNIMRCWDLGFSNRRDPTGDDRTVNAWVAGADATNATSCDGPDVDDDEVEVMRWEIQMWKGPNAISYNWRDDHIIASSEEERKVCAFAASTGICNRDRTISQGQFCAKTILSTDGSVFALSHTGSCSVRDVHTNKVMSVIEMPDVPFPVTPLAFLRNDRLLLLRINLDRYLIVCDWRNPKDILILKEAGGTTTDACAVSPDEKTLACWPHGFIEYYSMDAIIDAFLNKVPRMKRYTMVAMRKLFLDKRITVIANEDAAAIATKLKSVAISTKKASTKSGKAMGKEISASGIISSCNKELDSKKCWENICMADDDIFRYILSFV